MTIRHLDALFRPCSVAVIGASDRPHSAGGGLIRNLLRGGFTGKVIPVNPKRSSAAGLEACRHVAALPLAPDLAVICTPASTVPDLVEELAELGTRAVVVLAAGMSAATPGDERSLQQRMLDAARPHLLRILGPNCLGLIVPGAGLNASFAHIGALPGRLAFVSQSGALCSAVLDWAHSNEIGFSHFVSLGDSADVDAGDVLDYLGSDPSAKAILLHLESIDEARKFMSAARGAARNKPVLVIKSGRAETHGRTAAVPMGEHPGVDEVCEAALSRSGMLRVYGIEELFAAAETLTRARRLHGDRLAILTNGAGPGVMATDALLDGGGALAQLAPETIARLDEVLPPAWSRANPVDILGDASGELYSAAFEILLDAKEIDSVLVLHSPTAIASSEDAARAVVRTLGERRRDRIVLTSWLGGEAAQPPRHLLRQAGIATYDTPESAVRAVLHMIRYRRNQDMLMETPPSLPSEFEPRTSEARQVIEAALAEQRSQLTEPEAKAVLAAYGIPIVETRVAADVGEAVSRARGLGFPVALKILSPDLTHKSDVGGVSLDLQTPEAVRQAAEGMVERLQTHRPDARLMGFSVQQMARRPGAHELIVGAATDPVFGPVILFGRGGIAVEVIADRAVALPPLNMNLARELVSRTRVSRLLKGYRDRPAADLEAILLTLIQISQIIIDLPEVVELDVNPLLADPEGVLALDARISLAPAAGGPGDRLTIRPYPRELEETVTLRDGRSVLLRPIRPEDEPAHQELFQRMTPEDIYYRFFNVIHRMPHSQLARFTQIDYDREMAFIATVTDDASKPETLGVVRAVGDPDNTSAEFAISVRSDQKRQGLGSALLGKMIRYCRDKGTEELVGQALPDNRAVLALAARHHFTRQRLPGDDVVELRLSL
jgi:acetyltransferase